MDVAENSTRAGASLVTINVTARYRHASDMIGDNVRHERRTTFPCNRPFYTTAQRGRWSWAFLFKMAASAGGTPVWVEKNWVTAGFSLSHIDRMPLGDQTAHPQPDRVPSDTVFALYMPYIHNGASFTLDTEQMEILGGIPLNTPEVSPIFWNF